MIYNVTFLIFQLKENWIIQEFRQKGMLITNSFLWNPSYITFKIIGIFTSQTPLQFIQF